MSNCADSDVLQRNIFFCNNMDDMASVIVDRLVNLINTEVLKRGSFHMVFPGGHSPRRIFECLRENNLPWSKLYLYPSDERCVAAGHIDRNDRMIEELLLKHVPIPSGNVYPVSAESGPEEGARLYSELLCQVPRFDLVLLGVGIDGHTASIFPGSCVLNNEPDALPVRNAPKLPLERVTISLSRLRDARERWVFVSGADKQDVINRIQQQEDLPVTRILPTTIFIDKEAMI